MIAIDMIAWWYTTAWFALLHKIQLLVANVLQNFSVGLLASTLFSPFRQIDAGGVRGPVGVQLRAWFDRTFSRLFGAVIRSVMIISGCLVACIVLVVGVVWAAMWLIIPVLPVVGLIIMVII